MDKRRQTCWRRTIGLGGGRLPGKTSHTGRNSIASVKKHARDEKGLSTGAVAAFYLFSSTIENTKLQGPKFLSKVDTINISPPFLDIRSMELTPCNISPTPQYPIALRPWGASDAIAESRSARYPARFEGDIDQFRYWLAQAMAAIKSDQIQGFAPG